MLHAVRHGCKQLPCRGFPRGLQTHRLWQAEGRTTSELKSWSRYTSTIESVSRNEETPKAPDIQSERPKNGAGKRQHEDWPRMQEMEHPIDVRKFRHNYHTLAPDATIENEEVSVRGMCRYG